MKTTNVKTDNWTEQDWRDEMLDALLNGEITRAQFESYTCNIAGFVNLYRNHQK